MVFPNNLLFWLEIWHSPEPNQSTRWTCCLCEQKVSAFLCFVRISYFSQLHREPGNPAYCWSSWFCGRWTLWILSYGCGFPLDTYLRLPQSHSSEKPSAVHTLPLDEDIQPENLFTNSGSEGRWCALLLYFVRNLLGFSLFCLRSFFPGCKAQPVYFRRFCCQKYISVQ